MFKQDKYKQKVKKMEWCDLSCLIIDLEFSISKKSKKNSKDLKSLKEKLKILEEEKKNRLFNMFDMTYHLSKDEGEYL